MNVSFFRIHTSRLRNIALIWFVCLQKVAQRKYKSTRKSVKQPHSLTGSAGVGPPDAPGLGAGPPPPPAGPPPDMNCEEDIYTLSRFWSLLMAESTGYSRPCPRNRAGVRMGVLSCLLSKKEKKKVPKLKSMTRLLWCYPLTDILRFSNYVDRRGHACVPYA